MKNNPILRLGVKILFAPILLFGLYVQFHGDYGPGGGFQAGVIIAAGFILYGLVFSIKQMRFIVPRGLVNVLMACGVLLYVGVGLLSVSLNGTFLEYGAIDHFDPVHGQHLGILFVEFAVGVTVASAMVSLFYSFVCYKEKKADES